MFHTFVVSNVKSRIKRTHRESKWLLSTPTRVGHVVPSKIYTNVPYVYLIDSNGFYIKYYFKVLN